MSTQPCGPSSALGRATGASDRAPRPAPVVPDALNQAIFQRKTIRNKDLIHHSDCGSQYLSITRTERLAEAGIDPSVGTVGDSYDNALAECVIGLFKTEVTNALGPWKTMRDVEWRMLKWIEWRNNRRLLAPIGHIPPAEAEQACFATLNTLIRADLHEPWLGCAAAAPVARHRRRDAGEHSRMPLLHAPEGLQRPGAVEAAGQQHAPGLHRRRAEGAGSAARGRARQPSMKGFPTFNGSGCQRRRHSHGEPRRRAPGACDAASRAASGVECAIAE